MLRINLLPIRQLKKRAVARNQIVSFIILLIFLLVGLGAVGLLQAAKLKSIATSTAKLKQETQKYAPILAEMKQLEKTKQDLENKITIIKTLKSESSITVHILDQVAKKVDSRRMWLESLKQQGASLDLSGVALDNRTIAQFMDALQESPYVSDIDLSSATLKKVSGRNLKSFKLTCSIVNPRETTQETASPDKQK
ncbi:MAG: PilN domain-containing protein [Desulfocapsa sp.]|nr:PilN domain-containing protein [Desulfocapsa sp.]